MGAGMLWKRRHDVSARAVLAVVVGGHRDLGVRAARSHARLEPVVARLVLSRRLAVAVVLLVAHLVHGRALVGARRSRASVVILAAPAAYTLTTVNTPHTGAHPDRRARPVPAPWASADPAAARAVRPAGSAVSSPPAGSSPVPVRRRLPGRRTGGGGGGAGGLLNGSTPSSELDRAARAGRRPVHVGRGDQRRQQAAGYQLATDDPVMAIGGFNGTDPTPTLAQFQQYVPTGKIHWFIGGGAFGGAGRLRARRRQHVEHVVGDLDVGQRQLHVQTVGGVTVYDLTQTST